jgi:amidase
MIEIFPDPPVFNLGKHQRPLAHVAPDEPVRFHTTDEGYHEALLRGLDEDPRMLQRLNALTGPVYVDGALPGDALVVHIDQIVLAEFAYVVYIDRWERQTFGMSGSWIEAFPIRDGAVWLSSTSKVAVQPMIGCAGVAPAINSLSSLSPTAREGGNLDIRALGASTRLTLPVAVEGALFVLGDIHAAMGTGEPAGAGFECAGQVDVRFSLRKDLDVIEPRLETTDTLSFVGTDPHDLYAAKRNAIAAAWRFLIRERGLDERTAFALISGSLHLEFGGPAGANVLATFELAALTEAGVSPLPA